MMWAPWSRGPSRPGFCRRWRADSAPASGPPRPTTRSPRRGDPDQAVKRHWGRASAVRGARNFSGVGSGRQRQRGPALRLRRPDMRVARIVMPQGQWEVGEGIAPYRGAWTHQTDVTGGGYDAATDLRRGRLGHRGASRLDDGSRGGSRWATAPSATGVRGWPPSPTGSWPAVRATRAPSSWRSRCRAGPSSRPCSSAAVRSGTIGNISRVWG